ncbi:anthranilate synthase component 2/putative glutamine amidotransferase [Streptomyces sp. 1114.5]|uniref:gamma-glutamyl-gamma-aminobutyrate hydrolase family protein n=1 Tax=Streptomyces sp. 1114.5 TaxID=1938830 RepID=UPI000F20793C|nr:gamma-glutamyl-gamma-aminobutyrate hydrolase family protein [Streptomyces sp. 1114.5]RKT20031.1 anthranilate synthase component 2/putative glutamine amidotransferase [Streptomyces sp. 1114.5]
MTGTDLTGRDGRRRPLIGITSYQDDAAWSVWHQRASLVPQTYVDAVARSGGTPVLLPPQPGGVGHLLDVLDGLVLAGGPDVDPARYAAAADPRTGPPHRPRDDWESSLLHAALARDLPLLGICRGMQLLNVELGGTLLQHLPDNSHQHVPARFVHHRVTVTDGSRLAAVLGPAADVSCYHHQAVDRLGTGLQVTARGADGTVEALELPDRRFALGVQWHPETDPDDPRLFHALITAGHRTVH